MHDLRFFGRVVRYHQRRVESSIRLIQRRFRRFTRFGHARRGAPMTHRFPEAWRYSMVRREWRTEPESWLCCSAAMYEEILREAMSGAWGTRL